MGLEREREAQAATGAMVDRDQAADAGTSYDRVVLVDMLVAHQRKDAGSCICGWDVREAYGSDWENTHGSHAEHVAHMYELEVQRRQELAAVNWSGPPAGPVT